MRRDWRDDRIEELEALVRAQQASSVVVPTSHLDRFQAAFVPELTNWVHSVQTGETFAGANAWDGYMSMLAADACIQSLQSGASVRVPTPAIPRLYQ